MTGMVNAELQPGETVLGIYRTTTAAILRAAAVATAMFAVVMAVIRASEDQFGMPGYLGSVLVFGAFMAGAGWLMDRDREWVVTDRRIVGPRGHTLDINPDLRVRRLIYGLRLRQRGKPMMTIRAVPDIGEMAVRIRNATFASMAKDDTRGA
ncbi:hypothetical protein FNJ84_07220 [Paracoccus sp. M683]|uniref:hypothetical protein n=1 Tax=Paracoccus sp. M683 TaxID=2594268 RepID=UPI00118155FD|nr:hypothetical protein [Paracoccus sp. M683]TRW97305.1 hypothetical protein FNJ84_07220 [Paracoccus sp. M683]